MILHRQIPEEHLKTIGQITVNFTLLELYVKMFIWRLLGTETDQDLGNIITSNRSFRYLLNLLGSLYTYMSTDSEKISQLNGLLTRVEGVAKERNTIIHSYYAWPEMRIGANGNIENIPDIERQVIRFKTKSGRKKGLSYDSQDISINDLNRISDLILGVTDELQSFLYSFKPESPSK